MKNYTKHTKNAQMCMLLSGFTTLATIIMIFAGAPAITVICAAGLTATFFVATHVQGNRAARAVKDAVENIDDITYLEYVTYTLEEKWLLLTYWYRTVNGGSMDHLDFMSKAEVVVELECVIREIKEAREMAEHMRAEELRDEYWDVNLRFDEAEYTYGCRDEQDMDREEDIFFSKMAEELSQYKDYVPHEWGTHVSKL